VPRRTPPDPERDQSGPFPQAAAVHERILADPDGYPDGWVEQAAFRERYDLPPFRPPRFDDGTTVDDAVERLETAHGCDIEFVVYDVDEGWLVEIDGSRAFRVDRYRDDAANTVIDLPPEAFERRVLELIESEG
jgi:hypothetical protein